MQKALTASFIIISFLILCIGNFLLLKENKNLKDQKNELILKNDSLHIICLQHKEKLSTTVKLLDSLTGKNIVSLNFHNK